MVPVLGRRDDQGPDPDQGREKSALTGKVTDTLDQATGGRVPAPGAGLACVTEARNLALTTATEGPLCGVGHRLPPEL